MDKIATENWANIFSHMEQRLVHSCDRYAEVAASFEEPGLAKGGFSLIETPGMVLRQISLQADRQLTLCDTGGSEGGDSLFILQGGIESKFANLKSLVSFDGMRHGFQYNPNFQADHVIHAGKLEVFQISLNPDFIRGFLNAGEAGILERVGNSMERKEAYMISPALLALQPRMIEVIQAVRNCAFQGYTRYLFMEAKMLELFALQLDHITVAIEPNVKEEWSKEDKEKLKAVKEYIEQHYLEQLSLAKIISTFGLNEFKLKKGFKHLFSTTVFGYIHHLRMQKAKELLSSKHMNVSETAYYIGYNNIGSFSAEFKKRFGYPPSRC